jgi:hypothetical protein
MMPGTYPEWCSWKRANPTMQRKSRDPNDGKPYEVKQEGQGPNVVKTLRRNTRGPGPYPET